MKKRLYFFVLTTFWGFVTNAQQLSLVEVNSGIAGSNAKNMSILGSNLFVCTYDCCGIYLNGGKLWKTDGTLTGTQLVKDSLYINQYVANQGSVIVNNKMIFTAHDQSFNDYQPWVTDGTDAGTKKLKAINGRNASSPGYYTVLNNRVIFTALDTVIMDSVAITKRGLWVTDGTPLGTHEIYTYTIIAAQNMGNGPGILTVYKNKIYFFASDTVSRPDIWVTDGTTGGTHKVLTCPDKGGYNISRFIIMDSNLYVMNNTDSIVAGTPTPLQFGNLWRINLDSPSATLIKRVNGFIDRLTVVNNKIFFTGPDGQSYSPALWVSDGTDAGTYLVKDVNVVGAADLRAFTSFKNKLYFLGSDTGSLSLWSSDGTIAGTEKVKLFPDSHGNEETIIFRDTLYFSVFNMLTHKVSFYRSDGTTQGTSSFAIEAEKNNLRAVHYRIMNNALYFNAELDSNGTQVWKLADDAVNNISKQTVGNLSLYPNPATNELFFENEDLIEELIIYGIEGDKLLDIKQPANNRINISYFAKGFYIAEVKNQNEIRRIMWIKM